MIRRYLFSLLAVAAMCLMPTVAINAQQPDNRIVVWQNDGNYTVFDFTKVDSIDFYLP